MGRYKITARDLEVIAHAAGVLEGLATPVPGARPIPEGAQELLTRTASALGGIVDRLTNTSTKGNDDA